MRLLTIVVLLSFACSMSIGQEPSAQKTGTKQLIGLWRAKRIFGPEARGPLIIYKTSAGWKADFMGVVHSVVVKGKTISFEVPNDQGSFSGTFEGSNIFGQWVSGRANGENWTGVSPVALTPAGPNRWTGSVDPPDQEFTLFLFIQKQPDGTFSAIMRNPDRDVGAQMGVSRIVLDDNKVTVFGKRGNRPESIVSTGSYDPEEQRLSLYIANRGGHFDFARTGDESDFYPRGKRPQKYSYLPPPTLNDQWPTASLDAVDIDRKGIENLVQSLLDAPMEERNTPKVHAILAARHGKLVLEEYFHGFDRTKLHDLRSGTKSITATVIGAAMNAGAPLKPSTRVFDLMRRFAPPNESDPRKASMTLEHLMTMSSGFYCDDNDENAPGNEDAMNDQPEDLYLYTMRVPMASAPGEKAVYCSANAHLALGMVGEATNGSPLVTFDRLVARPLGITHYQWYRERSARPYGAGSLFLNARDYMKFGQLMLNDGVWRGRRILSHDYVSRASSSLYHMWGYTYGYFWWSVDYPYKNRTVRAFYAGGAGGQAVVVIPELDLVVQTFGGNYASTGTYYVQMNVIPRLLLPAVREAGDDKHLPVVPRTDFAPKLKPVDESGPVTEKNL